MFGEGQFVSTTPAEALARAKERYQVFHVVIEQGSYFGSRPKRVTDSWTEMLGNNVIFLKDAKDLSEVVLATLRVAEGEDLDTVIAGSKNPKALRHAFTNALKD